MVSDSNQFINQHTQLIKNLNEPLKSGTTLIGRFQIVDHIGVGGFGQVYKAIDLHLNAYVAIKMLHEQFVEDEAVLQQFKNELLILRQLSHQNILRVYEYYHDQDHCFMTMDWIDGTLLADKIKNEQLTFQQIKHYSLQIMAALNYAEKHEVCHRDLKPDNILIDSDDRLYVLDFGLAVLVESTGVQLFAGTPYYCAPEYLQDQTINRSTDYYSLGVILYEMCCQSLPYKALDMDALISEKHQNLKNFPCRLTSFQAFKPIVKSLTTPFVKQRIQRLDQAEEMMAEVTTVDSKKRLPIVILIVVVIFSLFLAWLIFGREGQQKPSTANQAYDSIVLLPFYGADSNKARLNWINEIAPEVFNQQLGLQASIRLIPVDRVNEIITSLGYQLPLNDNQLQVIAELLKAEYLITGKYTGMDQQQLLLNVDLLHIVGSQQISRNLFDQVISEGDVYGRLVKVSQQVLDRFEIKDKQTVNYTLGKEDLSVLSDIKNLKSNGDLKVLETTLKNFLDRRPKYMPAWNDLYHHYKKTIQINKAEEVLAEMITHSQPGHYYHQLARARLNDLNANIDEAKAIYESLLVNNPRDEGLLFEVAQFNINHEKYEAARQQLNQLIELSPNHLAGLFELSKVSIWLGDIQAAIDEYLVRALVSANKLKNNHYKGLIYNAFGVAYQRMGDLDLAIDNYKMGLDIRMEFGDIKGAATSLSNLATLYAIQGEATQAKNMLQQGVALLQESNNVIDQSIMVNKLGVLAEEQGLYKEALSHYQDALNMRLGLDDKWLQAESMNNVGFIFFLMTQLDHAVIYWQQAEKIYSEIGDQAGLLQVKQNMAQLLLRKGSLQQAFQSFESSLQDAIDLEIQEEQFVAKANLAKISFVQGNFKHAISELMSVLEDLKGRNDVRGQVEYGLLLAEWYFITGSIEQAKSTVLALNQFTSNSMSLVQQQKYNLLLMMVTGKLDTLSVNDLLSSNGLPEYELIQNYLLITRQFLEIDIEKANQLLKIISGYNVKLYKLAYLEFLELKILYFGLINDRENYQSNLNEALILSQRFPTYWRNYHFKVLSNLYDNNTINDNQRQQILRQGWDSLINEIPELARPQFIKQQQGIYQEIL